MDNVCIWIDSALISGQREVKRTIAIEPDKTISCLLDALGSDLVVEEARKNYGFVLTTSPHGTALDGSYVLQDLWRTVPKKNLFFTDISRTGKCMVSVEN